MEYLKLSKSGNSVITFKLSQLTAEYSMRLLNIDLLVCRLVLFFRNFKMEGMALTPPSGYRQPSVAESDCHI